MTDKKEKQALCVKLKRSADIIVTFFCFGWFTFGGGWSVIAQIQKEYVEKKHWVTAEELLDFTSIGRSIPGMMVSNSCFLFGYYTAGIPGGIAALIGMSTPAILIMLAVTFIYARIRDNVYVAQAMMGVGAAVVPIILSVMSKMVRTALRDVPCVLVMIAAMLICLFTQVSNFLIVIAAGAAGLLLTAMRAKP